MNGIFGKLLSNPHTTAAGVAFILIKVGREIAMVWAPQNAEKIKATTDILEGFAGFYGLALAGDAGRGQKDLEAAKQAVAIAIQTGNTSVLTKKDLPVSTESPKTQV